ncbi:MAG: hypothetical protein ICV62_07745 [Cyanobacteria bacterium Co-bin13]|nr:hypothetical protein [Cyanobacteria bacterium Co-bin13]
MYSAYSADQIVKTAQEIRPYLAKLLDAPTAQQVDGQLAHLLSQASAEPLATEQIVAVLSQHELTREWLRRSLEENTAAETILKSLRTYEPLTGSHNPIESPHYVCPVASCHQEWYRRDSAVETPRCPIHDVRFVRDSKGH